MYAQRLLIAKGDPHTLGSKWLLRFLRRHKAVKSVPSRAMDFRRLACTSDGAVQLFFDRLASPQIARIPPHLRFKADEVGISMTIEGGSFVIGPAGIKSLMTNDSANREWATVLETINAVGDALPPLVIFKGQSVQQQWFPVDNDEVNAPL